MNEKNNNFLKMIDNVKRNLLMLKFFLVFTSAICLKPKTNDYLLEKKPSSLVIGETNSIDSLLTLNQYNYLQKNKYSLGISNSTFLIRKNETNILKLNNSTKSKFTSDTFSAKSLSTKGEIKYNTAAQWRMVHSDSFYQNMTSQNWNYKFNTECKGNYYMLGGYCHTSKMELTKTYKLPQHKMVSVEALYHFIGEWEQNTGYMKTEIKNEEKYLWSSRCNNKGVLEEKEDMICEYTVCKMGEIVNVSFSHSEEELKIIFGATLTSEPCKQSYGISDVRIFIK